jgi:hypothetical protein
MTEDPNFDLLWYTNITMSQAIDLMEKGNTTLAVAFLNNVKIAIAKECPEAMQHDEKNLASKSFDLELQ